MLYTLRAKVAVVALLAAGPMGGLAGCSSTAGDPPVSTGAVDTPSVVQTSFPDLAAATGEPTLDGLATADPPPGSVVEVAGPFDDRFTLAGLRIGSGAVSGHLRITSDVSDVLELQVLAGFYDARGRFLGTGRATYHLDEATESAEQSGPSGPPSELEEFRIEAPSRYAARVASAAVGVPVLVNE